MRNPQKKLNEMEASDAEFKTMVIRMLKELRGRIDELSKHLNKGIVSTKGDIETNKKNVSYMKNIII